MKQQLEQLVRHAVQTLVGSVLNEPQNPRTVVVIQSGSATLLTGGAQDGATESSPGEWRGGSVRSATRQAIRAGDIVTTPAGTPHQMLLAKGERITYVVFKVAAPRPGERGAP